jgi:YVTN family beta-propeller protein
LVEFVILGPLDVRDDGRRLALGGPKQRAVLAMLLLDANRPVSRDRLIDGLWGESPPPSAAHTLDDYVSRLRRTLGGGRFERRPAGYLIRVEPGELDLERFEVLLERGRSAAAAGDAAQASDVLCEALGLWGGRALADLENEPFAASESERLEERRLLAVEGRIEAELECGRGGELVGELERLVGEHPFRERLLGQLMLALYRAGRQADALAAYRAGRRRLVAELGLEPSAELRALERRILEQDPSLAGSIASSPALRSRRVRRVRLVAAALTLAAVAASVITGVELGTGGSSASPARGSTAGVFELGRGSAVVGGSSLGGEPTAMVKDASSIWIAVPDASRVVRIDPVSRRLSETIPVSGTPAALAIGGRGVWVASLLGSTLTRIDQTTYTPTRISLGGARASALAFSLGHLWVTDATDDTLLGFDPAGTLRQTIQLDLDPTALAVGAHALWVAGQGGNGEGLLERIDPHSGARIPIRVGNGPVAVAVGDSAVWVANSLDSTVSKVDPESDTVVGTISVGSNPVALAIDRGSVEVANEYASSVSRIDARSGVVNATTPVGGGPTALVSAAGRIWVGTRTLGAHRGRTLVLLHTRPLALDPALQGDLPATVSDGLTYDALLTHPHTGGPQALLLIPDLAETVPTSTDDNTTYTFQLRPQPIYYSDGRIVRASDFRRAIERLYRIGVASSGSTTIIGANACTVKRCDLSRGIVTNDAARAITFHLRVPDPYFLDKTSWLGTAPVPPGTPLHPTAAHPIPATGPYMIASANNHEIRYVRNPHFREWSHAAQPDGNPDEIVMRYGLTATQETREVEEGKADWTGGAAEPIPAALQPELATRFPAQLHGFPFAETDFLRLNTTQPPFDDVRVRRALNLAIDREALVRIWGRVISTPTCQVLPPSFLGYRRYCPYTRGGPRADGRWTAPDLEQARRLVAASGTKGEQIRVWGRSDGPIHEPTVVPYIVGVLRRLGYHARARLVPSSYIDDHPQLGTTIQLIPEGLANGGTGDFFSNACSTFDRSNHRWFFCDRQLERTIQAAATLEVRNARAAGARWARIDREFVDRAAWVPMVNVRWVEFVSSRVHNYEADPTVGFIADQASVG